MPLVVPGFTSTGDQKTDWQNKLLGKKISESASDSTNFAKTDLPKEHRIIEPGTISTADFRPDRLNVHVGEDGTVTRVEFN
ncbi:MAG: hypothetical protein M1837_004151 [Sclerophora amabilis]|nr:MAG: hypothetical protein M1837_004151 [Sclerophora amabilis]